jgi:hypothetical protein
MPVTKTYDLAGVAFDVSDEIVTVHGAPGMNPLEIKCKVLVFSDVKEGVVYRVPFPIQPPPGKEDARDEQGELYPTPIEHLVLKLVEGAEIRPNVVRLILERLGPGIEITSSMPRTPPPGQQR